MHKLLLDQNLSHRILTYIKDLFPSSTHIRLLGLEKSDDHTVWTYAKQHDFTIVTQDADFNNLNTLYGFPPKIIWIRTGNTTTDTIITLIEEKAETMADFLENNTVGILELS